MDVVTIVILSKLPCKKRLYLLSTQLYFSLPEAKKEKDVSACLCQQALKKRLMILCPDYFILKGDLLCEEIESHYLTIACVDLFLIVRGIFQSA